ncbi:hypothetical protein KR222_006922 [Zaprionus bogoriensis]|nr:hypothetical protein KR222_006922 [Zaprionus bogoriensis]
MSDGKQNILQFAPFKSFVSPTFWHKLAELKLDYDRLSDTERSIFGHYTNRKASACLLEVDYSAYNSTAQTPKFCHAAVGKIYNKNTIEEFKALDKTALLAHEGRQLLADMANGRVQADPSLLARFFVLSFADLKSHRFWYLFAYPCPLTPVLQLQCDPQLIRALPNSAAYVEAIRALPAEQQNFFLLHVNEQDGVFEARRLSEFNEQDIEHYVYCFADPSEYENPAWLMRNYVAFLLQLCPTLVGKTLKFLGLRYGQELQLDNSLLWQVQQAERCDYAQAQFVGWQLNELNKLQPLRVDMSDSMDPAKLAETSVNLNLKLMKWRLVPDLNLELMAQTKCLLFGAGTLGCAVARNLLSWGFRHITLLDNGKVGYSNPVRQSLYTHADASAGNRPKATTAAQRLREINPSAECVGHVLEIPMPGHTIGDSLRAQTQRHLQLIEQQVQAHDVLFLLTDSRESRWLPTMLGAVHQKIVINAALGFDSYLVMRHGSTREQVGDAAAASKEIAGLKCIAGQQLGCYFCNDVTAPGNSLKDRTLDQQCTVTRPGVSNIAASYAVELLVALLQHPLKEAAPAYYAQRRGEQEDQQAQLPEGLLGILPHSIRGQLCNYENILPATQKFAQCIACSERVLQAYRSEGHAFLFKTFETAKYLEDLTGISEFMRLNSEIIDFDDDKFDLSEDEEED